MTTTVLVVDDTPTNVKLLEARLTNENYKVISSYNGADALAICMSHKIDVILSDVMMPHMDGFEFCSRLKSNHTTKNIPIILVTALDEEIHKACAIEIGADDFLTKPINEITLLTRVKNLVKQKKLKDEISGMDGRVDCDNTNLACAKISINETLLKGVARILLIDKCSRAVSKVLPFLSELHNVFVHSSDVIGLEILNEHRFDLIVLHMCEGSKDSLQFCSAVRTNRKISHLPILMITDAVNDLLSLALKAGVDDFVLWPINRYDLMARLNVQLANKRLADHLNLFWKGKVSNTLLNESAFKTR